MLTKITKLLIWTNICFILFALYAFGVFWQIPVIKGEVLTWQAVVEPFFFVVIIIFAYFPLSMEIIRTRRNNNLLFDKNKLTITASILLLTLTFGFGIHTAGQIIEESFINTSTSTVHYVESFPSKVAYFIEEDISHILIIIPTIFLSFILMLFDLSSEMQKSL